MMVCLPCPISLLQLSVAEVGILMGVEKAETFMVAMTDKTVQRLMHGS